MDVDDRHRRLRLTRCGWARNSKVADLRWPPRSPYEALMSSPNGRKRFQEMQERRQAGRASLKSFDASPYVRTKANQLLEDGVENDMEEEDEDEETLQLKLAAIEARLKLKKLQQSKSKSKPPSFEQKTISDTPASPSSRPTMRFIPERKRKAANMSQQENIQVPVSPSKRLAASMDPVSPRRIVLGIDKGKKGTDTCRQKKESEEKRQISSLPRKAQRVEEVHEGRCHSIFIIHQVLNFEKAKNISSASGNCSATQEFQLQMETRPTSSLLNDDSTEDNSQNIKPTTATDPSKFEPFSGLHLSTRILPHSFLNRTLDAKSPMRIPDLLRTIKGPEFDPPDVDGDYVVFGIIASKSTPKEHQDVKKGASKHKNLEDDGSNNTSKYMVLTLTDLKWSIDLFLFSTAFPRYYKLIPGTVVAILNPSIMPPPPNKLDTNRFSLTLNSSDDTILEIGKAQDLGFCKAIRKDGKVCETWVDGRKTEFCEFHVDLQLRKTTAKRMEVNGGPTTFGPGGRSGSRTGMFNKNRDLKDRDRYRLKPEGPQTDRSTGSTYYVGPPIPGSRSAASLIDADDPFIVAANDFPRGGNGKLERFQKRLAEQERERNIAKVLGRSNSVGAQYLRHRQAGGTSGREGSDANAPGNNTRPSSGAGNNINGKGDESGSQPARVALGLSSTMKSAVNVKLGRIKKSAVNKKTRFVTSKGIRDAGRDSLGGPGDGTGNDNNVDYDDDLDIV
ncbi:predicted protein [Histoplasma mississippiense (nom. inval.)]|uniref:predicted protein n=1 Tax=Ajellomyces capsulatus (strain NAm1 / WU24) TaxID=2059318 RepID=UPI000157B335|nr:predicted protein [Histoplasma mississippiense (nom. inval.)]EDN02235.1 predicted protein [Histoplasma mississippiense (nom. inval.)]